MSIGSYNNRHSRKLYRNNKRRRPYRKQWVRKKALDKKGFTRYSTGTKWSVQYFAEKLAFWRTHQVNWTEKYRDKHELLSNGYMKIGLLYVKVGTVFCWQSEKVTMRI